MFSPFSLKGRRGKMTKITLNVKQITGMKTSMNIFKLRIFNQI